MRIRTIVARESGTRRHKFADDVGKSRAPSTSTVAAVAAVAGANAVGLDLDLGLGDPELDRLQRLDRVDAPHGLGDDVVGLELELYVVLREIRSQSCQEDRVVEDLLLELELILSVLRSTIRPAKLTPVSSSISVCRSSANVANSSCAITVSTLMSSTWQRSPFVHHREPQAAADLLALAHLRLAVLQVADREDVGVVPALDERRVAEDEPQRLLEARAAPPSFA